MSTQELAERLSVSGSSIKHSMGDVREFLNEQGVSLVNIPQKGMRIEATEAQLKDLENLLEWQMNRDEASDGYRRDYIFETLFRYRKTYTLQLFAEELYVSRNVITKDLKEINEFLIPFHVTVEVKKNRGIIVNGHEFEIRQALIVYNNQKWWNGEYLETPERLDVRISRKAWTFFSNFYLKEEAEIWEIQEALLDIEQKVEAEFTDIALGRLMEYLLITRERLRINKKIDGYYREDMPGVPEKYLEAAEVSLKLYLKRDDACWEFEKTYLAARLYVANTIETRNRMCGYHKDIARYLEEVQTTIGRYYEPMGTELIDDIEDLIVSMQYSVAYRIHDWTDARKDVKERMAELYAICLFHIVILESATGLAFQEDDLARIVLLIYNYMKKKRKEAVFVTASSEEASHYNLRKLKGEFPYIYFKKIVKYNEFSIEDYSDVLVVSTVALKEKASNILCITKHVSDRDIQTIKEYLEVRADKKNEALHRVFREELIYDMVAKNKKDALEKAVAKIQQQGLVGGSFYDEVIKREEILATSIGSGVAIPHVYEKSVVESCVTVIRLKNSVKWSEDERVDLIFLFALTDEKVEDITKIFAHMYHVLKEDDLIRKIRAAADRKDVLRLVMDCEYKVYL